MYFFHLLLKRWEGLHCLKELPTPKEFIILRLKCCFSNTDYRGKWMRWFWKGGWQIYNDFCEKTCRQLPAASLQKEKKKHAPVVQPTHACKNGSDFIKRGLSGDWIGLRDHHGNEDLRGAEQEVNVGGSCHAESGLKWEGIAFQLYGSGRFSWPLSKHSQ